MKVSSVFVLASIAVACTVLSGGASAQYQAGTQYPVVSIDGVVRATRTMPAGSNSSVSATPGLTDAIRNPVFPSQPAPVINNYYYSVSAPPAAGTYFCTGGPSQGQYVAGPWDCPSYHD